MSTEAALSRGDRIRVRPFGSKDGWCVCEVAVASSNGLSIGALIEDGVLRLPNGLLAGAVLIGVDADAGRAYEVMTGTELEVELWRPM